MKKQIAIVLIILAGVLIYFVVSRNASSVPEEPETDTETAVEEQTNDSADREVRGTVVSVNTDQVAADGPALVTVRMENGSQTVIAVPSMGINLCAARTNIADVYSIKSGDRVEARGQADALGTIIPCESPAHYLRVVGQ